MSWTSSHHALPMLAGGGELWGSLFAVLIIFSHILGALTKKSQKKTVIIPPEKPLPSRSQPGRRPPILNKPKPAMRQKRPVAFPPARARPLPTAPVFNTQSPVAPAPVPTMTLMTQPASSTPIVTRAATSPRAAAIHEWLRPTTLQKQFILTEVFQPPLALRENQI